MYLNQFLSNYVQGLPYAIEMHINSFFTVWSKLVVMVVILLRCFSCPEPLPKHAWTNFFQTWHGWRTHLDACQVSIWFKSDRVVGLFASSVLACRLHSSWPTSLSELIPWAITFKSHAKKGQSECTLLSKQCSHWFSKPLCSGQSAYGTESDVETQGKQINTKAIKKGKDRLADLYIRF